MRCDGAAFVISSYSVANAMLALAIQRSSLILASLLLLLLVCHTSPIFASALSSSSSSSGTTLRRQPIGRLTSLDRSKSDTQRDNDFYSRPNLVTHTDDAFIAKLTALYDELLPKDAVILDMMSSHVSHLPPQKVQSNYYARVDVHGMNEKELMTNEARRLTNGNAYVRNLNDNPSFVGLADTGTYDCILCCVGVQYLEEPEQVFAEVARILKPDTGLCIVSFTNRFFYQKALVGWMERGMKERSRLVTDYLRAAGGFVEGEIEVRGDGTGAVAQLLSLGGVGGDPFVAVVGKRDGSE